MGNNNFDRRYPAMFQPGGEEHASQGYFPEPESEPEKQPPTDAGASVRTVPAPVASLPEGQKAAAEVEQKAQVHGPEREDERIHELLARPATRRVSHWSTRSWIICGLAIVLVFAGSAFCFSATALTPGSASLDPTPFHGIMVIPWGQVIFLGGPALLTAGLAITAAIFLLAARGYPQQAWRFQAAAGVAGLVTLGLGLMAVLSEQLFTKLLYSPVNYQMDSNPLPWYSVFALIASHLMILGPAVLALVVVLHPGKEGTPGAATPKMTFLTGALITAAGIWVWFSPQFFPLARGRRIELMDQNITTTPWTYSLSQAGGPLVLVGTLVLFWWVFIVATTRVVPAEDVAEPNAYPVAGE
ncbi:hypothetical protein ACX80D_01545 [Arthrobacter sp. Sr24]